MIQSVFYTKYYEIHKYVSYRWWLIIDNDWWFIHSFIRYVMSCVSLRGGTHYHPQYGELTILIMTDSVLYDKCLHSKNSSRKQQKQPKMVQSGKCAVNSIQIILQKLGKNFKKCRKFKWFYTLLLYLLIV